MNLSRGISPIQAACVDWIVYRPPRDGDDQSPRRAKTMSRIKNWVQVLGREPFGDHLKKFLVCQG